MATEAQEFRADFDELLTTYGQDATRFRPSFVNKVGTKIASKTGKVRLLDYVILSMTVDSWRPMGIFNKDVGDRRDIYFVSATTDLRELDQITLDGFVRRVTFCRGFSMDNTVIFKYCILHREREA